eukprot:6616610-Heterocapsa_arctica.AAC.1
MGWGIRQSVAVHTPAPLRSTLQQPGGGERAEATPRPSVHPTGGVQRIHSLAAWGTRPPPFKG